jgi:SAM-dependent methyltransferase
VIDAIERGEPWRLALERAVVSSGTEEALESIASEACGNWVWLTSFDRREAALDIGGTVSSMAPALSRHFRFVHHLESSALLADFAERRFAQDGLDNVVVARGSATDLPFCEDAFDCVTVHGPAHEGLPRILEECRRVLRPGGRLYVAFENPAWYGRLRKRAERRGRESAIVPAAKTAGFGQLSRFYAFPTFDRPRVIVPGTRRALYARETVEARGIIRRSIRRAAAYAGLYAILAPSVVIVARK